MLVTELIRNSFGIFVSHAQVERERFREFSIRKLASRGGVTVSLLV